MNAKGSSGVTSQAHQRHKTALKQFILITVVYVFSFMPIHIVYNGIAESRLILYLYYVNHVSNAFIYLAVNKAFRKGAWKLIGDIQKRLHR